MKYIFTIKMDNIQMEITHDTAAPISPAIAPAAPVVAPAAAPVVAPAAPVVAPAAVSAGPQVPAAQMPSAAEAQARLLSIPITDENIALNVIVSFINLAQRRGVFSLDESSKIWECIKMFQKS